MCMFHCYIVIPLPLNVINCSLHFTSIQSWPIHQVHEIHPSPRLPTSHPNRSPWSYAPRSWHSLHSSRIAIPSSTNQRGSCSASSAPNAVPELSRQKPWNAYEYVVPVRCYQETQNHIEMTHYWSLLENIIRHFPPTRYLFNSKWARLDAVPGCQGSCANLIKTQGVLLHFGAQVNRIGGHQIPTLLFCIIRIHTTMWRGAYSGSTAKPRTEFLDKARGASAYPMYLSIFDVFNLCASKHTTAGVFTASWKCLLQKDQKAYIYIYIVYSFV